MQVRFGNYPAVYGQTWTPTPGTWSNPSQVMTPSVDPTQAMMAEWARYWEACRAQAAAAASQWAATTTPPPNPVATAPPPVTMTTPPPVQALQPEAPNPFANAAAGGPMEQPVMMEPPQTPQPMQFAPQDASAGQGMTVPPAVGGNHQGKIAQALGSLLGQGGDASLSGLLSDPGQPGMEDMAGGFEDASGQQAFPADQG